MMPPSRRKLFKSKQEYQARLKKTKTVFDAISVGEGYNGRYIMGNFLRKRPEKRKIALIDPKYGEQRELVRRGVAQLRESGFNITPTKIEDAIKHMKDNGLRTKRITIDMPGAVDKEQFGMKTHLQLYKFDKLFAEARNILMPNGRIFVTTSDAKLCLEIIDEEKKHGLKVAGWEPYTQKETPKAVDKSYWMGRHLEDGFQIFRFVAVLPLTQTHTKKKKRNEPTKKVITFSF